MDEPKEFEYKFEEPAPRKRRISIPKVLVALVAAAVVYFIGINWAASVALGKFDYDAAIACMKWGASIDTGATGGYTALALTCQSPENMRQTKWLIAHGADVNTVTESGETPLMEVAGSQSTYSDQEVQGNIATAALLVRAGANVNQFDSMGTTALADACRQTDVKMAAWLLDHGADPNKVGDHGSTPLTCAIQNFNDSYRSTRSTAAVATIQLLLAHGVDPNVPGPKFDPGTPLSKALSNPEVAGVLLDHGANINAADSAGDTPIQAAALQGQADVIPVLAAHGADLNAPGRMGSTPIETARYVWGYGTPLDYKATYYALLKAGANPNAPTAPISSPAGLWPGAPPPSKVHVAVPAPTPAP